MTGALRSRYKRPRQLDWSSKQEQAKDRAEFMARRGFSREDIVKALFKKDFVQFGEAKKIVDKAIQMANTEKGLADKGCPQYRTPGCKGDCMRCE